MHSTLKGLWTLSLLRRVCVEFPSNAVASTKQTLRCLIGGVARGGQEDLPMGKASFLDKVIGKAEKVGYQVSASFIVLTP
jgi:hypothetical protein